MRFIPEHIPQPEYFPEENDVSYATAEQNDLYLTITIGTVLLIFVSCG